MADSLIISKSAFAARRGVSVSAVCKWIERKRIAGPALTADGRVVVDEAERQLGISLDVVRSEAASRIARAGDDDEPKTLSTREQILAVELEQKRRRLEVEKGVYVRADQVRAERGRALVQMIAAIDNWLPSLAIELGLDRETEALLRASWRRFRERQADAVTSEAEALPEILTDDAA